MARDTLQQVHLRISSEGFPKPLFQTELVAQSALDLELEKEDMLLKNQYQAKWSNCRDQNTIFFFYALLC